MESENVENSGNSEAARREARRLRILANSNNRLGKITGRVHDEEIPGSFNSKNINNFDRLRKKYSKYCF
jgi:hypothetical protein